MSLSKESMISIALTADSGVVYGINTDTDNLLRINVATGTGAVVGPTGLDGTGEGDMSE